LLDITKNLHPSLKQISELLMMAPFPFPELEILRKTPASIRNSRPMQVAWESSRELRTNLQNVPQLSKKLYLSFKVTGNRDLYEEPYNKRREQLSVATLLYLLGQNNLKELIEKYLVSICKELTWVVPAHEGRLIDLYSAETGLTLSDVLFCLGDNISDDVRSIVKRTIEERIFKPYLERTDEHAWYKSSDNWNAVCNSQIACTFLLLEKDSGRKARAISTALNGLRVYIESAFNNDGSTTEGVNYWNYGMTWFTIFSEMVYASTRGSINILGLEKVRRISLFPSEMMLSQNTLISFSDSEESGVIFHPGIIQRLSDRTGEMSLRCLINKPIKPESYGLTSILRYLLWWDGKEYSTFKAKDVFLPDAGIVKLTSNTLAGADIALAVKAGNNGENHNHNDIGSFILNIGGENLLTDPGPGLYNKDYFSVERYQNVFTNSYGHSVPKIDNNLQSTGSTFLGTISKTGGEKLPKNVTLDISRAYKVSSLVKLLRNFVLDKEVFILEDSFEFFDKALEIEEAFITWKEVELQGNLVKIRGENQQITVSLEGVYKNLSFNIESLKDESEENGKSKILKRISIKIPKSGQKEVKLRFRFEFS
ncbi:MAG: heparinase II/III family protein, partial [Patescibacteria group bacterium]